MNLLGPMEPTGASPSDPVTSLATHRSWRRTARGDAPLVATHRSWRRTARGDAPLVATHRSWRRTARGDAPLVATHRSSIQFYSTGTQGQGPPVADYARNPARARRPAPTATVRLQGRLYARLSPSRNALEALHFSAGPHARHRRIGAASNPVSASSHRIPFETRKIPGRSRNISPSPGKSRKIPQLRYQHDRPGTRRQAFPAADDRRRVRRNEPRCPSGSAAFRTTGSMVGMAIRHSRPRPWRSNKKRKNDRAIIVGLHPGTVDTTLSTPFQRNIPSKQLLFRRTPAARRSRQLEIGRQRVYFRMGWRRNRALKPSLFNCG